MSADSINPGSYTITLGGSKTVGAIHMQVTGFTRVTLNGSSPIDLHQEFDLSPGWNLLNFGNRSLTHLLFTFTAPMGTTGTMNTTSFGLFETDIFFPEGDELPSYRSEFHVPRSLPLGTSENIAGTFYFNWNNISWENADTLEALFNRRYTPGEHSAFVLIPDGKRQERFNVTITGPIDFRQRVPENYFGGAQGAMEFSEFGT